MFLDLIIFVEFQAAQMKFHNISDCQRQICSKNCACNVPAILLLVMPLIRPTPHNNFFNLKLQKLLNTTLLLDRLIIAAHMELD